MSSSTLLSFEVYWYSGHNDEGVRNLINEWNALLNEFTIVFRQRYANLVTALVYDTHALFTEVLNEPEKWGFKDNLSKCHDWECIWDDDLHPTFAMHKVVAKDLAAFLISGGWEMASKRRENGNWILNWNGSSGRWLGLEFGSWIGIIYFKSGEFI